MPRPCVGPLLSVRLTPETIRRVDAIAAEADTTRADIIRTLLDYALTDEWVIE